MKTKEFVLSVLEQNKNSYISGSKIAEAAKVSRTAVWKAAEELRRAGYAIDSLPNKGYRLAAESDVISPEGIAVYLNNKGFAGRIAVFDELESTNLTAKLNAISGMTEKSVIVARRQTAGAGHGHSRFASPEGGIYLSLIRKPEKETKKRLSAAEIGAAAAHLIAEETGRKTRLDAKLNRIYDGDELLAGILTEYIADLETEEISAYVIGIGIRAAGIVKNKLIAKLIEAFLAE